VSLYATIVAFAIPYHEPWADEAQAWQLARSLSLPALFQTYIRYEGSPGLWHFLLWVLVRARVSYSGLHWICGAIAVGATALLVFKSPFPRYLKFALPFTYFLLFQYAVVARSYVLAPVSLFLIALCWKKSPLVLALLLGLLANVALHAAVISGGLAVVYVVSRIQDRKHGVSHPWRRHIQALAILLGLYAFAIWTAWPPSDLGFKPTAGYLPTVLLMRLLELGQPWLLAFPFWIVIANCFRARRSLLYLLPVLLCMLFCVARYASWWHVGLLYPLLICLLWITWPAPGSNASRPETNGRIALMLMAAVQIGWSAYAIEFDHYNAYSPDLATAQFLRPIVQQGGTVAVTYFHDPEDIDGTSSGVLTYRSVGLLPYFDHNIYINQADSFWSWSTQNQTGKMLDRVLPLHPAVVIVEMRTPHRTNPIDSRDPNFELLSQAGYKFTRMFCGARPISFYLDEKSCHLIFQHVDIPQEPAADKASTASEVK